MPFTMKTPPDLKKNRGTVYLVGAGPGDPSLLTLRGRELLAAADAVFYDHLVHPDLLRFCPRAALHYVGKVGHADSVPQDQIEAALKQAAEAGMTVVRLKGGDPFIFGRGGEEAEYLSRYGIPFEIVPGVSSAIAVPAYAGIPLTHRSLSSRVTFVTGHEDPEKGDADEAEETLVMLMSVKTLRENLKRLIRIGRKPSTPAAIIEWGTYPRQRTLVGDLAGLANIAEREKFQAPAIAVIGEVVRLRNSLAWFEKRPLFGKRVLVTRARLQASDLSDRLREWGAEAIELPTIEIIPPSDPKPLDAALADLARYSWVLFTSVHGVDAFFNRLLTRKGDIRSLGFVKLAAVGPATAGRLSEKGFLVDRIAEEFSGEKLAQSFSAAEVSGQRLLLPRAEVGGEDIERILREKGADLDVVSAYRNGLPQFSEDFLDGIISNEPFDLLTFTSPSTLKNFVSLLQTRPEWTRIKETPAVVIGPVTKKTAVECGMNVAGMPAEATLTAMLGTVLSLLSASR